MEIEEKKGKIFLLILPNKGFDNNNSLRCFPISLMSFGLFHFALLYSIHHLHHHQLNLRGKDEAKNKNMKLWNEAKKEVIIPLAPYYIFSLHFQCTRNYSSFYCPKKLNLCQKIK